MNKQKFPGQNIICFTYLILNTFLIGGKKPGICYPQKHYHPHVLN